MSFDKVYGLLIGAATGDALGSPHEFQNLQYTGKFVHRARHFRRFQNIYLLYAMGQVTDDTEMSLCLSRVLAKGPYSRSEAITQYLQWANDNTHSMGCNTRALFKGIKTLKGYEGRSKKQFADPDRLGQSNGALMRCAILACREDYMETAVLDCQITNPDPICVQVNQVYLTMVRRALLFTDTPSLEARTHIFEAGQKLATLPELQSILATALKGEDRDVRGKTKGWCLHAFYCMAYALLHCSSYKMAIDWAIRKGGDTDTNACIVGALWGALEGYEKMTTECPEEIQVMLQCSTLPDRELQPDEVAVTRSERHRAQNIEGLARALSQ
jgi:ADP-ribosyl-[dinitrogen reductase] hydrolase